MIFIVIRSRHAGLNYFLSSILDIVSLPRLFLLFNLFLYSLWSWFFTPIPFHSRPPPHNPSNGLNMLFRKYSHIHSHTCGCFIGMGLWFTYEWHCFIDHTLLLLSSVSVFLRIICGAAHTSRWSLGSARGTSGCALPTLNNWLSEGRALTLPAAPGHCKQHQWLLLSTVLQGHIWESIWNICSGQNWAEAKNRQFPGEKTQRTGKHLKFCSNVSVIRKMWIKTDELSLCTFWTGNN